MEKDNLIDGFETPERSGRPAFLTVLCILTWIGSVAIIGLYGYSYVTLSSLIRQNGETLPEVKWVMWNMIVACVGSMVCIIGSIAMWNLRRWGFYVYVIGQVVPLAMLVFLLLITARMLQPSGLEMLLNAAWILIPIGFTIMYAVNLKYIRR
jgi:hypothetical protein